jgi:hypothetical protein
MPKCHALFKWPLRGYSKNSECSTSFKPFLTSSGAKYVNNGYEILILAEKMTMYFYREN